MFLEVAWDGQRRLSFGLSQFHGHGTWLVCEVALTTEAPQRIPKEGEYRGLMLVLQETHETPIKMLLRCLTISSDANFTENATTRGSMKHLLSSAARNRFHSMHPVASQPGILAAIAAFNGCHASSCNLFVPPSL
jgi:hypothetical protein